MFGVLSRGSKGVYGSYHNRHSSNPPWVRKELGKSPIRRACLSCDIHASLHVRSACVIAIQTSRS